jgi:hypothetical protein
VDIRDLVHERLHLVAVTEYFKHPTVGVVRSEQVCGYLGLARKGSDVGGKNVADYAALNEDIKPFIEVLHLIPEIPVSEGAVVSYL